VRPTVRLRLRGLKVRSASCRNTLLLVKPSSVRLLLGAALVAALFFASTALAAPATTKLTLSGSSQAPGGKGTVMAKLTAGGKALAGKAVALYAGGASPLTSGTTDSKGKVAFAVTVTGPTQFQARYAPAPPDSAAYGPATSNTLTVAPSVGVALAPKTYLRARHKAVGIPHARVGFRGSVATFTPGLVVTVDVFRSSKRVVHGSVPAKQAGARGAFQFSFKPKRRGVYHVRVSVPGGSRTVRVFVVRPHASQGSRGTAVRALQSRMKKLGYLIPVNGRFDSSTARAVLAFRKVNHYARTTSASAQVFKKLARGGGGFRLRYRSAGKHVEFDWSRQVLVLARAGKPVKILPASSGKPSTPTVFGKFHFYRKSPGFNSHGMYFSNYFIGGYAIHGYDPVPTYAASHGCIRIPIPSARTVYAWVHLGDTIYVYH
jgi:hypothetical protein